MDAMKDLRAFIFIIMILAFVWLFTGGPLRPSSKSGWFLNKPQQKAAQEAKKQTEEILETKSSVSSKEAAQNFSSKQSSSASSPLPYLRGDDGRPQPSSSSGSGVSYGDEKINNSASVVLAASKQSSSTKSKVQSLPDGRAGSSSQSSVKPDFATLKTRRAKETKPDEEYLEIKADKKNKSPMKITGWKLKGKTGLDVVIGKGASYIYASAASQPQEDIYLKPGEKAVIVTGKSPLGTSFKLNKCAGYFEQFREFTPELDTECPLLRDEEPPSSLINNDQCLDYIDRVSSCQTVVSIPYKYSSKLSSSCQDYVLQNANYKTCLEEHKDDSDFYLPEWRVYLERSEELWEKKRETITLYDDKNNIIDSKSY